MTYQIDQSIKIENTSKTSYVAIANGTSLVCAISAKDKRILTHVFRQLDKPLIFMLFTFSFLCAKVIEKTKPHHVVIDTEYKNHDIDVKNYITQILIISDHPIPEISFRSIGKKSHAHKTAYLAYKTKQAKIKVSYQEVIKKYEQINR